MTSLATRVTEAVERSSKRSPGEWCARVKNGRTRICLLNSTVGVSDEVCSLFNGSHTVGNMAFITAHPFDIALIRDLHAENERLRNSLKMLHEHVADYITVNHLGPVNHNLVMKQAAEILGVPS